MRHFLFILAGIAAVWGSVVAINRAQSGVDIVEKIQAFRHPVATASWTSTRDQVVTILMEEWAASGTDTACELTLDMLDQLTSIAPGWRVHLISPTGWVPIRWNPIDRDGVEWMIQDWSDERRDEDEERPQEWKNGPPPSHKTSFRTANSH